MAGGQLLLDNQDQTNELISELNGTVEERFGALHEQFDRQHQDSTKIREDDLKAISRLFEVFEKFEGHQKDTREMCKGMSSQLGTLTEAEQRRLDENDASQTDELTRQLLARSETIDELQRQLQLTTEDYAAKINDLRGLNLQDTEASLAALVEITTDLRNRLEQGFGQKEDLFKEKLQDCDKERERLQSELLMAREEMASSRSTTEEDIQKLSKTLHSEKSLVGSLQARVLQMEMEADTANELRDKWSKDIDAIDKLRPHIKSLQARFGGLQKVDGELAKLGTLTGAIRATSTYFRAEQGWVREQLETSERYGNASQPSTSARLTGESGLTSESGPSSRRVMVRSPSLQPRSPSPAPSINSEQARRRGASKPRSILKITSTTEPEGPTRTRSQFFTRSVSNQYNRPVFGETAGAAAGIDQGMVDEIRDRLLGTMNKKSWELPSIQDFEKSSQPARNSSQSSQSTNNETTSAAKRVHPDSLGDLAQGREKIAKLGDKAPPVVDSD